MQSDITTGAYTPVRAARPRLAGGRYELLSELGSGSLGTVHRALDTTTGGEVAVKLLHERHRASRREVETFWREARAGELVDHPNVTRVLDSGNDPVLHDFVVMELLTGITLEHKLSRCELLPRDRALNILDQVLSGLSAMHEAGVVHRDLKPENIVIERRRQVDGERIERVDHVKLCDFGLAKLPPAQGESEAPDTLAGTLCGTPEYMAPEQAQGRPVGPQADLYACGVILYQLVTGHLPFTGDSARAVAAQHIGRPLPPPRRYCPELDLRLERILIKALAKRPADRFASAGAMRAAIEALADPSSPPVELGRAADDDLPAPRLRWDDAPTQLFRPVPTPKRAPVGRAPAESPPARAPSRGLTRRARLATGLVVGVPLALLVVLVAWLIGAVL